MDYTTPKNTTYSASIGGVSKTQAGYDNTAHLSGTTLPLVGKAYDVEKGTTPSISMQHIASLAKIVVTNNSGESLTITSVAITAPENIVGSFKLDFSDPDNVGISDGAYTTSKTATLKVTGGTALADGEFATFYIPIKPIDLAIGDKLTVKVNTYSKVLTMTKAVTFSAGEVKTINFNYNKTFTSQNFTLASSISAGDKNIITDGTAGTVNVMGRYSSGNNIPSLSGTISGGVLASTSSMGIYTVGYDAEKGYSFYDEEQKLYLNATSSGNTLKSLDAEDDYKYWTVSITAGVAEILNKGRSTYHIRKNSSSDLFSTYSSAQKSISIFKYDPRTPVELSFASTSISKTTTNYNEFYGQTVTASPSVSPITYAMTGDAIGSIDSETGVVSLNGSAGTATVTASFAGDATYIAAEASYTITVVGTSLTPSFSFTSCPDGWPSGTNNSGIQALTGGSYDYVVSERTYSFTLDAQVGYHTGKYLAVMKNHYVGLPKLSGYKLVKVVIGNSSGCSTTTQVKISSDTAGETVVSGGTAQTFSTTGTTYTYNLTGTADNTMYYFSCSGNTQIVSLALTYDKVD